MGLLTSMVKTSAADRVRYPKMMSGMWYDPRQYVAGSAVSTIAVVANTLYASPIWIPAPVTLDRIGTTISSAAAAGKIIRFMLYWPGTDDLPGALLLDGGTAAADATGDVTVTISQAVPAGLLYVAGVSDGTPTLPIVSAGMPMYGTTTPALGNWRGGPNKANGSTTAPNPFGALAGHSTNTYFRFAVRAA